MKTKAFDFSLASPDLSVALKKVISVVSQGPDPKYAIASHKKRVCVIGIAGEYRACYYVPNASAESDGAFGVALDIFEGVTKGRAVLDFKVTGQSCAFKATQGKYSGDIPVAALTSDFCKLADAMLEAPSDSLSLSSDLLTSLKAGLSLSAIKDVYRNTNLVSYITVEGGKLQISCFDGQHFSLVTSPVSRKSPKLRLAIPAVQFNLIDQLATGEDVKISVSSANIVVSGNNFSAILPATQAEDTHFNMVSSFIKALPKPSYSCTLEPEAVLTATDNLITLYSANTTFVLSARKGSSSLSISFSSGSGNASDSLKVEVVKGAEFKVSVDPRLFKDILGLSKVLKTPTFGVTDKVLTLSGAVGDVELYLACAQAAD